MSDKRVLAAIVGGFLSALLGGLFDCAHDRSSSTQIAVTTGGVVLWIGLMIVCGIAGSLASAKWTRGHIKDRNRRSASPGTAA